MEINLFLPVKYCMLDNKLLWIFWRTCSTPYQQTMYYSLITVAKMFPTLSAQIWRIFLRNVRLSLRPVDPPLPYITSKYQIFPN